MLVKELSNSILGLVPAGVVISTHIEAIKELRVSQEDFDELCHEVGFSPELMDYVALPIACQSVLVVPVPIQELGYLEVVIGFQVVVTSEREDYNKARSDLEEDGPPEENGYATPK